MQATSHSRFSLVIKHCVEITRKPSKKEKIKFSENREDKKANVYIEYQVMKLYFSTIPIVTVEAMGLPLIYCKPSISLHQDTVTILTS